MLVIYDRDHGVSVTNDAENVIAYLAASFPDLYQRPVIYRDTDGIFDGLAVNRNNHFAGFYPIRERDVLRAVAKAKDLK